MRAVQWFTIRDEDNDNGGNEIKIRYQGPNKPPNLSKEEYHGGDAKVLGEAGAKSTATEFNWFFERKWYLEDVKAGKMKPLGRLAWRSDIG